MSRELTINIWCDPCLDTDDLRIEAKEMVPIAVGAKLPRVLALCEEHQKTLFEPFLELLTLGVTNDQLERPRPKTRQQHTPEGTIPATQASEIVCPVDDCESELANTSSLRAHIRTKHDTTIDELLTDGAQLFDATGAALHYQGRGQQSNPPATEHAACDQKGCDTVYTYPEYKRPAQALGLHKRKAHGIVSPKAKTG